MANRDRRRGESRVEDARRVRSINERDGVRTEKIQENEGRSGIGEADARLGEEAVMRPAAYPAAGNGLRPSNTRPYIGGRAEGTEAGMRMENMTNPFSNPLAGYEAWMAKARSRSLAVGEKEIREAEGILRKYKDGKLTLERRVVENEKWFRLRHWDVIGRSKNTGDPEPSSGWLFNSLQNKHADAMDNFPTATVLPREEGDKADAEVLSSVLPTVLEQNEYEQTYSDMWWEKLKTGTGVTGVFWDSSKLDGLGDIAVRSIDLLNLFWEPGVNDIQQSANVFHVELRDRDALAAEFPDVEIAASNGAGEVTLAEYVHDDTIDISGKVLVVDWYYKRALGNGRTALHYCKFAGGKVLYASENEPAYAHGGYYEHGKYPFVFDVLFPIEDSPAGFGLIDICKSPQIYIDKLDQALLKNTVIGARPRYWVKNDGGVNEKEFADMSRDFVHFTGSDDPRSSLFPIETPPINPYAVTMRTAKVDELKEISGNRDFSQGATASGVTAASAIAALQEAGSKTSRDVIKASYRAFSQIGYLCIELMRQFYTEPRTFRVIGGQGQMQFTRFSGRQIGMQESGDSFMSATRIPYFDIRVVAQKASPFSTVAQNERAKELYGLGFFRPDMADQSLMALEMMQFEGIEAVKEKISQNGTLYQKMQQLTPLVIAMAQQLDQLQGTQYTPQVAQILGMNLQTQQAPAARSGTESESNPLGDALNGARKTTAGEARKDAAANATPR